MTSVVGAAERGGGHEQDQKAADRAPNTTTAGRGLRTAASVNDRKKVGS